MCKFKCGKNCPHCEWYEPGGYFYESDCEGYRDEGCNIDQDPETCTKYEPTYVQSLLDEIDELKAELENFKKVDEEKLAELELNATNESRKWYINHLKEMGLEVQNLKFSLDDVDEAYISGYDTGYRKAKEE